MAYTVPPVSSIQPKYKRALAALGLALSTSPGIADATTQLLLWGTGVPTETAPNGSLAIRLDGASAAQVLYFRQGGAWVAADLDSGSGAIADVGTYYTVDTIDGALDALGLQIGGDTDATYAFTEQNLLVDNMAVYAALERLDLFVGDLAATANGEGASMVSIEDALTLFTATTVEGALAEVGAAVGKLISGSATILNGATSVVIGGVPNGKRAVVSFAEGPTAALRVWAAPTAGGNLTIEINQDNTADLDVHYLLDAR